MTDADRIALKRFVQQITEQPWPLDQQPCRAEGVFRWCTDWELIELGKCLFLGEATYLADPPPRRLRFNPLWSQDAIVQEARRLLTVHADSVDTLLSELQSRRASYAHGG